ncbi:MAG: PDZ domain-containing protein [Lutibacter sp.]|uniref:S41 family peptidase n=1 Tax=Lutibacter sp. TaxID=1925666 RepID=UPI0018107D1D|nr:S41 family peptidase [Lutibacter sp.]MBT8317865.1 PDZ domain-containing protein [Lutibacter sp.]NNJ58723.1 PDZ domain-containing protein [Lutibacter sp.]
MKKFNFLLYTYFLFSLIFISCTKNDDVEIPQNIELQDFVWKGMNSWYNWQSSVPSLADSKDDNTNDYFSYLNNYATPESLFESLIYNPGTSDRFSWFIEDYVVQNNAFQGISVSFGFRLQAVSINDSGDIIFYVRYVAPNSAASGAGIKRGDIINALNGEVLNESNYSSVVASLSNETVTLSFVSENEGTLTFIEDKTITATQLSENPVHFSTVFNDVDGKKVGYLVYNSFRSSYNDELNAVFSNFENEGITELILDLRLNGGGSVLTSAYLASMIYKDANNDIFAELRFNEKHLNENGYYNFDDSLDVYDVSGTKTGEETINRLTTINQLYVLTSSSTASASEMVINGLKAFIPVKVVGSTTYGKNVGSITLYDSPSSEYTSLSSANPDHLNAMQPIVFQIYNKTGQSDYTLGFEPDIEVKEYQFWNTILPFGDENEVVLKAALDDIRGLSGKSQFMSKYKNVKKFDVSELEQKFEKEMYIDATFFDK